MTAMATEQSIPHIGIVSDNLQNKIGYSTVLADKVVIKVRGFGSVLTSAGRAVVRAVTTVADYLHLGGAVRAIGDTARWARSSVLAPVYRRVRGLFTPAAAVYAGTSHLGQRAVMGVVDGALAAVRWGIKNLVDLVCWLPERVGRPGRFVAEQIRDAELFVVEGIGIGLATVRTKVGPWVHPDQPYIVAVNRISLLIIAKQVLWAFLPVWARIPAVVGLFITWMIYDGTATGVMRLRSLSRVFDSSAEATKLAAEVMESGGPEKIKTEVSTEDDKTTVAMEIQHGPTSTSTSSTRSVTKPAQGRARNAARRR